jgi:hypothetical protein
MEPLRLAYRIATDLGVMMRGQGSMEGRLQNGSRNVFSGRSASATRVY